MENIEVAREMLKKFGTSSKPFLTGLSVDNQKSERLWKDVLHYVLHYYSDLFYFMEANDMLDPLGSPSGFATSFYWKNYNWNNHKLRTEHSQLPNQLWITGIHQNIEHETVQQITDASSTNM